MPTEIQIYPWGTNNRLLFLPKDDSVLPQLTTEINLCFKKRNVFPHVPNGADFCFF